MPQTDSSGRTAQQFLDEFFEFDLCDSCGYDAEDHTPVMLPTGTWFAYCNKGTDD